MIIFPSLRPPPAPSPCTLCPMFVKIMMNNSIQSGKLTLDEKYYTKSYFPSLSLHEIYFLIYLK